ncbi:MAG: terpene cyclase/mutase family protein [Pirellulaceae bacterium]|nr:terpene cyclase/mutase family protein [Pirellulaceae bacterium]
MIRGFSFALLAVLAGLPVQAGDQESAGSGAFEPPTAEQIEAAIGRGVQFLLDRQNPNGSWGGIGGNRPYEVYAPVPGAHHAFRAAVTALSVVALIEAGGEAAEVQQAIERGEAWLLRELPSLRRATPDAIYNTWGHAYAIQALVRLLARHPEDESRHQRIREVIAQQIELLDRYEVVDGGWAYYDFEAGTKKPAGSSISFVTATVLIAFDEARDAGFEIPERLVQRGRDSILRQRKPDFSYLYGEYLKARPMREINRPAGSLGRSQVCNLALRLWGDEAITDEVVQTWLDRLFARNGWLSIGRKRPIPHESWFQVAGYFFYYGHYYAAACMELLPAEQRGPYQAQMAALLIGLQERDGSWWDFPLYDYHQQYGTAFALMSLHRCRKAP